MLTELKKFTILYVEDEPEIQENISAYLESYFSTVYIASTGKEGLDSYEKYRPDVLLLDINIPDIDGLELAKIIRQKNESVKILMLTAHTETDKLLTATELKLTKYLVKPLNSKSFKEALMVLVNELKKEKQHLLQLASDCFWDRDKGIVILEGEELSLSNKEYRLLKLLISKKSELLTYIDIILNVWDNAYEKDISVNSVKNQVKNLRKKLPEGLISSVYSQGYMLK